MSIRCSSQLGINTSAVAARHGEPDAGLRLGARAVHPGMSHLLGGWRKAGRRGARVVSLRVQSSVWSGRARSCCSDRQVWLSSSKLSSPLSCPSRAGLMTRLPEAWWTWCVSESSWRQHLALQKEVARGLCVCGGNKFRCDDFEGPGG